MPQHKDRFTIEDERGYGQRNVYVRDAKNPSSCLISVNEDGTLPAQSVLDLFNLLAGEIEDLRRERRQDHQPLKAGR